MPAQPCVRSRFFLLAALSLPVPAALAPAQPPAPVPPTFPTLAPVQPLGAQRGTTLDLTLTGTNLSDPTGVWTSFPAKVTIPTDGGNGKNPASLKVKLEIPRDAPLGFHGLRVATSRGISNTRPFCIDALQQVASVGTNRSLKAAQAVTPPCVVTGRMDAEQTDYYKVNVKAGQRLSFEVLGRRLGSAFDPELTLLDAGGKEVPAGYANDSPGLQTDARLTYTFKTPGDYILALKDVSYRGGPDFFYRLRIGDFPCATTPLPLAVKRGTKTKVSFTGPVIDGVAPVEVDAPTDPLVEAVQVAPVGASGLPGWPVMLALSDLEETLEAEPNNDLAKANRVPVPGAVTGRFAEKDDIDHFVFKLAKGKRYILEAHTSEHLSPTDVILSLKDGKGAQLQASNPAAPPRLDFTAPADADYALAVEHLHSWGGPDEVYRITVTPFEPSFSLTLNADRFTAGAGGTFSVPVFAARNGYNGPIEVSVLGAKGLTGTLSIPAGAPKPNVPSGVLTVKVADDVPPGPVVFAIAGKATIDGKAVTHLASVRGLLSTGMANLPVPPRTLFNSIGLAVTEKPPFSLAAKFDAPEVMPGKPATLTITAMRAADFPGEIALTFAGLPPGVTAAPAKIAASQNEVKATLNVTAGAKPGSTPVTVRGAAKHGGKDFAVSAAPVALVIKK